MNIFLMRHGAAEGSESGKPDEERQLTPEGKKMIRESLPGLANLVGGLDFILTSGLARATGTATIVGEFYGALDFMEALPGLSEPGQAENVTRQINKLIGKENVLVVGHMPYLGELCRYLVKNMEEEPDFKKGSVAKIYVKGFPGPDEGVLKWIMTSDDLRKSGVN